VNGAKKWHPATGPAFYAGEQWESVSGKIKCEIVSIRKWGDGKWSYDVTYRYRDGQEATKDAWNFQVRYQHIADKHI